MLVKIKKFIFKKKILMKILNIYLKVRSVLYYNLNIKEVAPKIDFSKVDKVLFVAHPDDEILFFSKKLLTEKGWLIISVTNGGNKVRAKEFIKVVNTLGHSYQMWNFPDGLNVMWNKKLMNKKIEKILNSNNKWKIIMTHNEEGDYDVGHNQHKQLHYSLKIICDNKDLYCPELKYTLFHEKNKLPAQYLRTKLMLLQYYKSQAGLIDDFRPYVEYENIIKQ